MHRRTSTPAWHPWHPKGGQQACGQKWRLLCQHANTGFRPGGTTATAAERSAWPRSTCHCAAGGLGGGAGSTTTNMESRGMRCASDASSCSRRRACAAHHQMREAQPELVHALRSCHTLALPCKLVLEESAGLMCDVPAGAAYSSPPRREGDARGQLTIADASHRKLQRHTKTPAPHHPYHTAHSEERGVGACMPARPRARR